MSYYYNYYIGYEHEGKIYPFGPYNAINKRIRPVISRSSSFASDLHGRFWNIKEEQISEELGKEFEWNDGFYETSRFDVKYLPIELMPDGSSIKRGYFLIDEVRQYEEDEDCEVFSECLTPTVYAAKLENQLKFGRSPEKEDCEGYKYKEPDASDYMYYAYEDSLTEEWESSQILLVAEMLNDYSSLPKGAKIVILEDEG